MDGRVLAVDWRVMACKDFASGMLVRGTAVHIHMDYIYIYKAVSILAVYIINGV